MGGFEWSEKSSTSSPLRPKKMLQILNTQSNIFHIFLVQTGKNVVQCPKMGEWASHPALIKKNKLSPISDAFLNFSYVTESPILRQPSSSSVVPPQRVTELERPLAGWENTANSQRLSRTKPPRPANDMYSD